MDLNAYVAFLLAGVVLVFLDGMVIYRNGRGYLENSYGDPAAGVAMARLVAVLFHLVVLGVLALISTVPVFDGSGLPSIVGRLGILLLVLALAHGVTMAILGRVHDAQVDETMVTRRAEARRALATGQQAPGAAAWSQNEPVVNPVPGQSGRIADVSPSLEQNGPYTTQA